MLQTNQTIQIQTNLKFPSAGFVTFSDVKSLVNVNKSSYLVLHRRVLLKQYPNRISRNGIKRQRFRIILTAIIQPNNAIHQIPLKY